MPSINTVVAILQSVGNKIGTVADLTYKTHEATYNEGLLVYKTHAPALMRPYRA